MCPSVDFTGVTEGFEPIPDGKQPATLEAWEWNDTPKSSNAKTDDPTVALTFRISDGEFEGRKMFRNYSMSRQALWAFKRALVRLGIDPSELDGDIDLDEIMPDLVGAECVLKIGHHMWEGEARNDIKDVLLASEEVDLFANA